MKKSAFLSAVSIGVLSISMAFANPAAVSQVRTNSVEVMKILNKANGKNNAEILRQAENYASPYFDFERMTALAVGLPWKTATQAQKTALVQEFKDKLIRDYTGTMADYKNAKVVVLDKTTTQGNIVWVKATVTPAGGKAVNLEFGTYPSAGKYRILNVKVEGGSLVTAYRNQFGETIKKKGIDGLIAELKAKNGK